MAREDGIHKLNGQTRVIILQCKLQCLGFRFILYIDRRQSFKGRLARCDCVAGILEFRDPRAVSQLNLIGRPTEITCSILRIFLGQSIQREGRLLQQRGWREGCALAQLKRPGQAVVMAEPCTPVYMGRIAVHQLDNIAGIFGLKVEQA